MASKVNLTVILILMLTNGTTTKPSRRLNLEIFGMECITLSAVVRTFNCNHLKAAPGVYYFNDGLIFSKDLNEKFDLRVRFNGQYLKSNVMMTILDYKLDICENLQTSFKNLFIRLAMEELRRTSNLPYKCPFKAGELYKFENFTLMRDIFPPYTPEMNFTVTVNFIYKNVEFARQILTGSISL